MAWETAVRMWIVANVLGAAFLVTVIVILMLTGSLYATPQARLLLVSANPAGDASKSLVGFHTPPVYAVVSAPNGSVRVWAYNPNSLPAVFNVSISAVAPNGSLIPWIAVQPTDPKAGSTGEICGFDFGYFSASARPAGPLPMPPEGVAEGLGGWGLVLVATEGYPTGTSETVEWFVRVGNGTWAATPSTAPAPAARFQVWPQEVPPDWPYPELVNTTSAALPWWWGIRSYPPCFPGP
ncbi:MAG: hypothetical protein ACP5ID_05240 [Conexivisphaera sp.]